MIKICLLFSILFFTSVKAAENKCYYSDNFISPDVKVNVEQLKNGDYKYSYLVANQGLSRLPVIWFFIETNKLAQNVVSPPQWRLLDWGNNKSEYTKWSTVDIHNGDILPGQSVVGFEFVSKNPPGAVKFRSKGTSYLPLVEMGVLKKDVLNLCPGSYQAGSSAMGFDQVDGITVGPIPINRKTVDVRIRRVSAKSKWSGGLHASDKELLSFSPLEKGKVEVALIGNDKIDVSDVNPSTIQLGSGKAKPLSASISDCDISEKKIKALLMTFNIEDVNVLCNADHAIFLNGKTKSGQEIFGGAKIKVTECNQENWQREAQRMIEAGEVEIPEGKYKAKR